MSFTPVLARTLLLGVFGLIVAGCDSEPTDYPSEPGPLRVPKVGSTFTYRVLQMDSIGREVPGTDGSVTATILSNDASFDGRERLTLVAEDSMRYYLEYDGTGDVFYRPEKPDVTRLTWQSWPFGSKVTVADRVPDTTLPDGRMLSTIHHNEFSGTERTQTPAGAFDVYKGYSVSILLTIADTTVVETLLHTQRWYAPSLGVPVRVSTEIRGSGSAYRKHIKVLTVYSLR